MRTASLPKHARFALPLMLGLLAVSPARAQDTLTVLAGDPSGVYFPLAIAAGKILSDAFPDRTVRVQVTKGSSANLKLLAEGQGEIAFALGDALIAARRGDAAAGFDKPLTDLRNIATLYPNLVQIVATAKSGIRNLPDLKGKRLSVGAPESGTELNARKVLAAAGLNEDELGALKELGFSESIVGMKDDKLDAALQSAGIGVASLNELGNTNEIAMIPVPPAVVAKMGAPFSPATIPANTYRGQNQPVPTAAIMNYLVTRAELPDDLVTAVTKALFDRLDELKEVHLAAREMTVALSAQEGPAPTHPGAQLYFRAKLKRVQADALNARGVERLAKGERVPALADFEAALRLDPQHEAARDNQKALARVIERDGAMMGIERRAK